MSVKGQSLSSSSPSAPGPLKDNIAKRTSKPKLNEIVVYITRTTIKEGALTLSVSQATYKHLLKTNDTTIEWARFVQAAELEKHDKVFCFLAGKPYLIKQSVFGIGAAIVGLWRQMDAESDGVDLFLAPDEDTLLRIPAGNRGKWVTLKSCKPC